MLVFLHFAMASSKHAGSTCDCCGVSQWHHKHNLLACKWCDHEHQADHQLVHKEDPTAKCFHIQKPHHFAFETLAVEPIENFVVLPPPPPVPCLYPGAAPAPAPPPSHTRHRPFAHPCCPCPASPGPTLSPVCRHDAHLHLSPSPLRPRPFALPGPAYPITALPPWCTPTLGSARPWTGTGQPW